MSRGLPAKVLMIRRVHNRPTKLPNEMKARLPAWLAPGGQSDGT